MDTTTTIEFDTAHFEKKLHNLKDTQDSITGLSKWCLNKRAAHKQIVKCWLNVLKNVKIEHRLALFYLANDVIQHSKRKNYEFVASWGTTLQKATTLVRDDKVKEKISRIFNIWEQREIYTEDFIADLHGLLAINPAIKKAQTNPTPTKSASPVIAQWTEDFDEEFQLSTVITNIRNCVTLESDTDKNLKIVVKTTVPDMEKTKANLKDRSHVEQVEREIENAVDKYQTFATSLNAEINARKILLAALDQADKFYRTQRRDVKKVVYAYKNFGDRIKSIQTELNQKINNLPSPIPSPDINAPSPEADNDFDLPGDINFYNSNMNGFGSYLNRNEPLPFDLNEFYRDSPPPNDQSIEVIHSQEQQQQSTAPLNDFYNSLIPSKLDSYNPAMNYGDSYQIQGPPLPPQGGNFSNNSTSASFLRPPPLPPAAYNPAMDYGSPMIPEPPLPDLSQSNDDYTWDWNSAIQTPISPPHFERKGNDSNTIRYVDESLREINNSSDIDHRQLPSDDSTSKDVDHRNLISLTGSPRRGSKNSDDTDYRQPGKNMSLNGKDEFLVPPLEQPRLDQFGKFMAMVDKMDPTTGQQSMSNFSTPNRNSRPALLPTPTSIPPRFNRNISINSDTLRCGPDDESVDMEMSDDDTGIDNRSVGSAGDHRDFYNASQPPVFALPHQVNMNRPPPLLPESELSTLNMQRKPWMHGGQRNVSDAPKDNGNDGPPSLLGLTTPNFVHPNQHNFPAGNFRGNPSRGKMNRGGLNNSPYNNTITRGRGGIRGRRGTNFHGGQW